MSAILPEKDINLVIDLKKLEEYLDTEEKAVDAMDILGLPVPLTPLPISPGRNVAVLVEVAVRNFRLKHMGFDSEREFELKLKYVSGGRGYRRHKHRHGTCGRGAGGSAAGKHAL